MYYADSHFHTSFSGDSETDPHLQIERAIALGMKQITVTDHHDIDFPPSDCNFDLDIPEYTKAVRDLSQAYADRIDLGLGIELGLQPHLKNKLPDLVSSYNFDFIIGSTHVTRGVDPYETELFMEGMPSEEAAYRQYFEEELENLTLFDCYDVAGHLDYVVRYGPNQNRYYSFERYGDVLDAILKAILAKDKGIELNTAGFKAGLGYGHPMPEVLKRYRELGGEILTIGSDAHTPEYMGDHFAQAGDFLKSIGFKYYCVFRSRKPEFLPL